MQLPSQLHICGVIGLSYSLDDLCHPSASCRELVRGLFATDLLEIGVRLTNRFEGTIGNASNRADVNMAQSDDSNVLFFLANAHAP